MRCAGWQQQQQQQQQQQVVVLLLLLGVGGDGDIRLLQNYFLKVFWEKLEFWGGNPVSG